MHVSKRMFIVAMVVFVAAAVFAVSAGFAKAEKTSTLLEFYSDECSYCADMEPLVERLASKEGIHVKRLEVYYNNENKQRFFEYDKGLCGGVPFYFNTANEDYICGAVSYERLLSWAKGNKPISIKE